MATADVIKVFLGPETEQASDVAKKRLLSFGHHRGV